MLPGPYAERMPRSAIEYLVLLPLLSMILTGAGLLTNRSWLFSLGFGLLLASVAVLIVPRRQRPRQ